MIFGPRFAAVGCIRGAHRKIDAFVNFELSKEFALLRYDEPERINNYLVAATTALTEEAILTSYAFARNDRSIGGDSPIFCGMHSSGDITKNLEYWIELAHVRGPDGSNKLRGYGVDVGATYEVKLPLQPSLTFGYALLSAQSDRQHSRLCARCPPVGLSRKLGSEIDLVFGYRKRKGQRVSALLTLISGAS